MMYSYTEIPLQNKQDAFSSMYMYVGRAIMALCGREGEGIIREAVRRFGEDRGRFLKAELESLGLPTDLHNLYHRQLDCRPDPRLRADILVDEAQRQIWEVYTCPMADLWNKGGESKLGSFFCEEHHHALVGAYTEGFGQTNLSKLLTCPRDVFCRFSVYFREANTPPERAKQAFPGKGTPEPAAPEPADFHTGINTMTIKLYYYLLQTAAERRGAEGECAVAEGLRNWAPVAVAALRRQAKHTLNPCDRAFAKDNFPLALDSREDALWQDYDGNQARMRMQVNLLDAVVRALDTGA